VSVADREDGTRGGCTKEGYGRTGGKMGISSVGRVARSVAVYASARLGKVTSDIIDARDVCRDCALNDVGDKFGIMPGCLFERLPVCPTRYSSLKRFRKIM
jgi:hypothetical protein